MRPKTFIVSTAATGYSPWHMLNYKQTPFDVGFLVNIAGNTGTYTVEHGFSDLQKKGVSISRATTTATVTYANHGLKAGDSIVLDNVPAPFKGTFQVASVSSTSVFTFTVPDSGAAAATGDAIFISVMPHSSGLTSQTTTKEGNYNTPIQFIRLSITVSGAGHFAFTVTQGS